MDQKYRFKYRYGNQPIVEMDAWDVPEMVRNAHEWICMDDVSRVLLGAAADEVLKNIPAVKAESKTLSLRK